MQKINTMWPYLALFWPYLAPFGPCGPCVLIFASCTIVLHGSLPKFLWKFSAVFLRCGTMKIKAGEDGEKYIIDYGLIYFDLVIIVTVSRETTFAKKLNLAITGAA